MEWAYPKRRGPGWKQGWTGKTMASVSAPPIHLMAIFGIVVTLLWVSQYRDYKSQIHNAALNFQLFLFFLPLLILISNSIVGGTGRLNFHNILTSSANSRVSPWGAYAAS